jgi:hypothetical protein
VIDAQGADIIRGDFFGDAWVNHYSTQPTLPSSQAFDQYTYLQQLGENAAFNTIEEYIALVNADPNVPDNYAQDFRRFAPATSDTVDPLSKPASQAWLDWRATLRSMYDNALEDSTWTPWPTRSTASRRLSCSAGRTTTRSCRARSTSSASPASSCPAGSTRTARPSA